MKLYLILLVVSFVADMIVEMEVRLHVKRNYKVLYTPSISEKILARIKTAILAMMIFPNILSLLCDLFAHDAFIKSVDNNLENNKRFEKIS